MNTLSVKNTINMKYQVLFSLNDYTTTTSITTTINNNNNCNYNNRVSITKPLKNSFTSTTLLADSVDDKWWHFSYFSKKIGFDVSCKLRRQIYGIFLLFPEYRIWHFRKVISRRQFAWYAKSCFLGRIRNLWPNGRLLLLYLRLASNKRDINKQCRPRSDDAVCSGYSTKCDNTKS